MIGNYQMQKFIEINEALEWVMARKNRGYGFEHFQKVMEEIGNPQNHFPSIHIAGTNGKGSTCYYLSKILETSSSKVGLYTSPHLVTHLDRIRINGERIPEDVFLQYLNDNLDLIETNDLAMFEIDFLIMSLWFQDEKVDYAVVETGLGGRLDATNTIQNPLLSIITTIGYDHMDLLGDTLEKIAYEKAGIIKTGSKILTGNLLEGPLQVIQEVAKEKEATWIGYEPYVDLGEDAFSWRTFTFQIPHLAQYQKANISLALQAASILEVPMDSNVIIPTIEQGQWLGRYEVIQDNPLVILDGAHNVEGITALVHSLQQRKHPCVIVYSALKDKQGIEMAKLLNTVADRLLVTEFVFGRADTAEHLASEVGEVIKDYKEAITLAKQLAQEDGMVVVCGSLYFISEVRAWMVK